ncbi:hypothetical protein [Gilliamella sp. Pas-s25]|uniref:hypothetical protein n=1 Tax=Gilliamella sp. Pas-s25 TaxID=2687310 RepID=UPI00135DE608|nr:hypothetical protein [Gilliamella sp. Pas-s25]MWP63216.1 hypothetical protein [Gilliamella sp. Pas-s25]
MNIHKKTKLTLYHLQMIRRLYHNEKITITNFQTFNGRRQTIYSLYNVLKSPIEAIHSLTSERTL